MGTRRCGRAAAGFPSLRWLGRYTYIAWGGRWILGKCRAAEPSGHYLRVSLSAMKSKLLVVGIFGLAAALVGCKKDVTKDIAKFADQACACKDATCATGVLEAFVAFAKANKDAGGDKEEAAKSAKRMATCMITSGVETQKLMTSMQSLKD